MGGPATHRRCGRLARRSEGDCGQSRVVARTAQSRPHIGAQRATDEIPANTENCPIGSKVIGLVCRYYVCRLKFGWRGREVRQVRQVGPHACGDSHVRRKRAQWRSQYLWSGGWAYRQWLHAAVMAPRTTGWRNSQSGRRIAPEVDKPCGRHRGHIALWRRV